MGKVGKSDKEEKAGPIVTGVTGGFVSQFVHSLDPKKRLTIPSDWRAQVGTPSSLYVLPGLNEDKCLYVYPAVEMAQRLEKFRKLGIADSKARVFLRTLASGSDLVTWDTQGRIRVKDELLDFAQLTEQIELVGAFDHFELWNPELWKAASTVNKTTVQDALRYFEF